MATQAVVSLVVDESGAVPGLTRFQQRAMQSFQGPRAGATSLDEAIRKLTTSIDGLAASGQRAGGSLQKLNGHVTTNLDSVRLLSQEFGLRIPRALESMLSRIPAVAGALSGLLGGFAAIGGIEIFAHAIEGADELYHKFFDVNAALDEYLAKAGEAANTKFIDTSSLETARASLESLKSTIDALDAKRKAAGVDAPLGGLTQYITGTGSDEAVVAAGISGTEVHIAPTYSEKEGTSRAQAEAERAQNEARAHELSRQYAQEDLHDQSRLNEAGLHGEDLRIQKQRDAHRENAAAQKVEFSNELDQQHALQKMRDLQIGAGEDDPKKLVNVPLVDAHAGEAEQRRKDAAADAESAAQEKDLRQESRLAIMKADDAAAQSRLQGEALYFEKMKGDIRETTAELIIQGRAAEIPAKVREINEKYFDDLGERVVKAQAEIAASLRRAQGAGLTGAAAIEDEFGQRLNENNTKYAGSTREDANVAAKKERDEKIEQLQREFNDRMQSMGSGWVDSQLNGYQRIEAEAARASRQIEEEFTKAWGGKDVDHNSTDYQQALAAKNAAVTDVQKGARAKESDLDASNRAEDLRYDQEAAAAEARIREGGLTGWVDRYRQATSEIRDQENQRFAELEKNADREGLTDEEIARRRTDIERQANAEVASQAADMQRQIASNLEEAFTHPVDFIKRRMEQMFMEIIANWLMQTKAFQAVFGQIGGQTGPGGQGGLLGTIGSTVRGTFGGHPSIAGSPEYAPATSTGPGSSRYFAASSTSDAALAIAPASASTIGGGVGGAVESAANASLGIGRAIVPLISRPSSSLGNAAPGDASTAAAAGMPSGVPSIAGDGTITPEYPDGLPNIQNGLPNAPLPQSMPASNVSRINQAMGIAGAGVAGYEGYQDTVAAFKSGSVSGMFKGALSDAMVGATIGSFGGPVGAAIGAGVGAAVGLVSGAAGLVMGEGGKLAARDYYKKELFPEIEKLRTSPGGMDYMSSISEVNRIGQEGRQYMSAHWGVGAEQWVDDNYLRKELSLAAGQLGARARGGAYATQMSAAQFHGGGTVTDFGDLATSSTEGYIHAMLMEKIVNPAASATHGPTIDAMNSGASPADIAAMYAPKSQSSPAPAQIEPHIHIHTLDAKTMKGWLRGGGARLIKEHLNGLASVYGGDGG